MKIAAKDFKMTELGPVPKDWEVVDFDECFDLLRTNTYARAYMTDSDGWINNVHYGDVLIKYGSMLDFNNAHVPCLVDSIGVGGDFLEDGDVVIADTAEDEAVGKATEICNVGDHRVVAGLHTIACRPKKEFARGWLGFFINSSSYHDQLLPLITGIKVSSVSKSAFRQTKMVVPPLPEQRKIAAALSDVDEMIVALEKLIGKKRKIKTGAMQRLLTGKTRLPGFKGAWVEKRLGEVVEVLDNRRVPLNDSQRQSGPYPYCGANGIVDFIDRYIFDEEVILMAEDGGNFQDFANRPIAYKMRGKFWVNNHAHVLKAVIGIDQDFLFCQLVHKDITDTITGGTREKLTRGQLENLMVVFPPTLAEQKAIAKVLGDMDEEIAALEAELAKARQLKQGMMQELLTGKVRLV